MTEVASQARNQLGDYYAGVETGSELIPRLALFVDLYREHRRRLGRPVSVLDIGCGREAVLSRYLDPADGYAGCDIARPRVDLPRFRQLDLNRDSLAATFGDETFDVIFFGEVLEHVFSPDEVLENVRAVMNPDSLLIMSTPNLAYWVNRLLLVVGINPLFLENSSRQKLGRRFTFLGQGHTTEGHIRVFTHTAVLDLIATLKVFEISAVHSVPVWRNPIDRVVCRFSAGLAPDNVYSLRTARTDPWRARVDERFPPR